MAMTSRKNSAVKALQAIMASEKKYNQHVQLEWLLSCNTNSARGKVYGQAEIKALYDRDDWSQPMGATKTTHLDAHDGTPFKYIVIKRHQTDGYIDEHAKNPTPDQTGNQLVDEIHFWVKYELDATVSDAFCPMLKYFTSKSDKVVATSEKMQDNVIIISQRACEICNAREACEIAYQMNIDAGIDNEYVETPDDRREYLDSISTRFGWRDAMGNGGNSGVIYDYAKQCYKAVFVDYAL